MGGKNIRQEYRLKTIAEIKNYFIKEKEQNEVTSKKHKKVYTSLNYIEHFLIVASSMNGCVSISVLLLPRNYEF